MIFYHAGAKPASKAHPWDSPRLAAGQPINVMITYYEFQGTQGKKKRKFLRQLEYDRTGKEYWEWIAGYEKYYKISTHGRVKSVGRKVMEKGTKKGKWVYGKILKQCIDGHGYPYVCLNKDGKNKRKFIHRLVIETFRGEKPPGMEVRHLDDIKSRCVVDNLEYGTHEQNGWDGKRNGKYTSKVNDAEVNKIRRLHKKGWKQSKLAKKYHLSQQQISRIINGRRSGNERKES